jgi:CDP-glucose 4,6-dehydratase
VLSVIGKMKESPLLLMVTTDKVYRNDGRSRGYVESDELGGKDPYSSSKAIADLLVQAWQVQNPQVGLGIARAGNVIGGGDSSKERLLPDLIASVRSGRAIELRSPQAVRPWQHVLDCLAGYRSLIERIQTTQGYIGAWNIGPESSQVRSVIEVAKKVSERWGSSLSWNQVSNDGLIEADFLMLDSTKARNELPWIDRLDFEKAVEWTVDWHLKVDGGYSVRKAMEEDVEAFLSMN